MPERRQLPTDRVYCGETVALNDRNSTLADRQLQARLDQLRSER
jgi:hypothetical protein